MIRMPVESLITKYLYSKASKNGVALSGTFELTPLCNMNCKMCYVRLSKQEQEERGTLRTAEEWIALAKEAKDAGMLYILLTGGEPFMHPQFRQIMRELHHMGFVVSINSNGTMIDEAVVEWLKDVPPARMNITLYGASDETYEKLCANSKGFTQTTHAIDLLCKANIPVKINCSITPYNVHDLPFIIEYAKQKGLHVQPAAYMFPPVRKNSLLVGKNDRFSPEEAAYYSAYADYLVYGKDNFWAKCAEPLPLLTEPEESCEVLGEGLHCRAGKCSFWVNWEGNMMPCGMFSLSEKVDVFKEGFSSAWEKIKEQTALIRLPGICAGCSLKNRCRACAAMVYTESGCFDKVPEYRCKMMKAFDEQRKRVEMLAWEE